MKTLEQLWKENGEKPGLRVIVDHDKSSYLVLVGRTPVGKFLGYWSQSGEAYCKTSEDSFWCLYQEPKPRRLAWICIKSYEIGKNEIMWEGNVRWLLTEEGPKGHWERAPWLDEPEDKK